MTHICHSSLKVMSYNIWFDEEKIIERILSLMHHVDTYSPDVMCFQEVLRDKYEYIKTKLKPKYGYCFPELIKYRYGCAIFSKYPIDSAKIISMTSSMGRELILTKINVNNLNVVIANTHFESEFKLNNVTKIKQFKLVAAILNQLHHIYGDVILCADTNVVESEREIFKRQFCLMKDSFVEDGSLSEKEYTYDSMTNLNLRRRNIEFQSRIDRILFRTKGTMKVNNFSLLTGIDDYVQPSDHHGIMTEFSLLAQIKYN